MSSGILYWTGTSVIRQDNPDGELHWAGASVIRSNNSNGEVYWAGVSIIRSIEVQSPLTYKPRQNHRSFTTF